MWDGGLLAWDIPGGHKADGLGSASRLRRRNGGAYQLGHFGAGCAGDGQATRFRQRAYAAAQPDVHRRRRGLLWVGWFGFNAGSALAATEHAASAFAATHFAAAAGGLAWAGMEWITRGKPSVLGTCSGVVAGLVCITPASGFVQPMPALVIGVAAGVVCFLACTTLKTRLRYDDSLDAFGVHGVGGTLGAILTGVFATRVVGGGDASLGLVESLAHNEPAAAVEQAGIVPQILAVGITWLVAGVATFVILKVLDVAMGLRLSHARKSRDWTLASMARKVTCSFDLARHAAIP